MVLVNDNNLGFDVVVQLVIVMHNMYHFLVMFIFYISIFIKKFAYKPFRKQQNLLLSGLVTFTVTLRNSVAKIQSIQKGFANHMRTKKIITQILLVFKLIMRIHSPISQQFVHIL